MLKGLVSKLKKLDTNNTKFREVWELALVRGANPLSFTADQNSLGIFV
jgi:hypothetical protein